MPEYKLDSNGVLRDDRGNEIGHVGYDRVVRSGDREIGHVDHSGGYYDEYGRYVGSTKEVGSGGAGAAGAIFLVILFFLSVGIIFLLYTGWKEWKAGNQGKALMLWGILLAASVIIPIMGGDLGAMIVLPAWILTLIAGILYVQVFLLLMVLKKISQPNTKRPSSVDPHPSTVGRSTPAKSSTPSVQKATLQEKHPEPQSREWHPAGFIACKKCGLQQPEYREKCVRCEAPLHSDEAAPSASTPPASSQAQETGTRVCDRCGSANPEEASYCTGCGKALAVQL